MKMNEMQLLGKTSNHLTSPKSGSLTWSQNPAATWIPTAPETRDERGNKKTGERWNLLSCRQTPVQSCLSNLDSSCVTCRPFPHSPVSAWEIETVGKGKATELRGNISCCGTRFSDLLTPVLFTSFLYTGKS